MLTSKSHASVVRSIGKVKECQWLGWRYYALAEARAEAESGDAPLITDYAGYAELGVEALNEASRRLLADLRAAAAEETRKLGKFVGVFEFARRTIAAACPEARLLAQREAEGERNAKMIFAALRNVRQKPKPIKTKRWA